MGGGSGQEAGVKEALFLGGRRWGWERYEDTKGKEGEKRQGEARRSHGIEVKGEEKISGIREDRCKKIIVSFVRMCHCWCERREGEGVESEKEKEKERQREYGEFVSYICYL